MLTEYWISAAEYNNKSVTKKEQICFYLYIIYKRAMLRFISVLPQ